VDRDIVGASVRIFERNNERLLGRLMLDIPDPISCNRRVSTRNPDIATIQSSILIQSFSMGGSSLFAPSVPSVRSQIAYLASRWSQPSFTASKFYRPVNSHQPPGNWEFSDHPGTTRGLFQPISTRSGTESVPDRDCFPRVGIPLPP